MANSRTTHGGKGDSPCKVDRKKWDKNFDRIKVSDDYKPSRIWETPKPGKDVKVRKDPNKLARVTQPHVDKKKESKKRGDHHEQG